MSDFDQFDDQLGNALRLRSPDIDGSGLETAAAHDAVESPRARVPRQCVLECGDVAHRVLDA